jgi:hypothetical protein
VRKLRDEVISEWLHFWLQFAADCGCPYQIVAAITQVPQNEKFSVGDTGGPLPPGTPR